MREIKAEDMRHGESWEGLLKRYRIRGIEGDTLPCVVTSESGNRYTVNRTSHIDRETGSLLFRWTCDCPARTRCRHIDAVEQVWHAEAMAREDYDETEILERSE